MDRDMSFPCGGGTVILRAGAIILKDGCFLMVRNDHVDYFYSVGGRIRFGETAEEAVVREVFEETGVRMEVDHLGFVYENYFPGDPPFERGKLYYEIGFYFYMKTPEDFEPASGSFSEAGGPTERLVWVSPDEPGTVYPAFFRTELDTGEKNVKHMVRDDRWKIGGRYRQEL